MMNDHEERMVRLGGLGWAPSEGIMFVLCCGCRVPIETVPVAADDVANGAISHGMCPDCVVKYEKEMLVYQDAANDERAVWDHPEESGVEDQT